MNKDQDQPLQTPIEDLRRSSLEHYDQAASSIFCHHSEIPKAINFYYDCQIKQPFNWLSFWWGCAVGVWWMLCAMIIMYII